MGKILKVLAVEDPAVIAYVDEKLQIVSNYNKCKVEFDIVPWQNYFTTMMKVFNGEIEYDIIMVAGHLWLADLAEKEYIEPIKYESEDILPIIANEMKYNQKTYLSPSFCDGHIIAYRKSIISKVIGTNLKEVISVDELIQVVKKLKDAGIETPIALKADKSEIFTDALPYLRSTGLDVYEQKEGLIECNIDKMREGLDKYIYLKSFAPTDTNTYGNTEIKQMISTNKVPIAVTWSGQMAKVMEDCIEPDDLGFSTFNTAWNVTWSFAIAKTSNNKEEAKEFLSYLRSEKIDNLVGAYCGAPVRKSNYIKGMDKYSWYKVQLQMIENYATPLIDIIDVGVKNENLYNEIYNAFIETKK